MVRCKQIGLLCLGVTAMLLGSSSAPAQRIRFPSGVQAEPTTASQAQYDGTSVYQQPGAAPSSEYSTPSSPGSAWQPPGSSQGTGSVSSGPVSGQAVPSPWSATGEGIAPSSPSGVPSADYPPGTSPYYGPAGPGVAPGPGATYQGSGAPPATWDPYATPGSQPSLFPQNPTFPTVSGGENWAAKIIKFRQATGFDYTYLSGNGGSALGLNDLQFYSTFAFPFFYNPDTPLLVTPGFGLQLWSGPLSHANPDSPDLPGQTYDAYIDAAWNPQISEIIGGELAVAVGVHSDFSKVNTDSIRITGKGFLTLAFSPNWTVKGGILYLDRVRVTILPAGGLVWVNKPVDPEIQADLLFPNPRLSIRLPSRSNTDWWWYVRGNYGGGSWYIERTSGVLAGEHERVDYNDIRVATGFEFQSMRGLHGSLEIGVSAGRELVYERGLTDNTKPDTAFLAGATLAF